MPPAARRDLFDSKKTAGLMRPELCIDTAASEQLIMRPLLYDPSLIDDDQAIHRSDR